MLVLVLAYIKDRQENETRGTCNREEDGQDGAQLVEYALVGNQLAGVTEPPFRQKRQI